jgi:hypothetical protein
MMDWWLTTSHQPLWELRSRTDLIFAVRISPMRLPHLVTLNYLQCVCQKHMAVQKPLTVVVGGGVGGQA